MENQDHELKVSHHISATSVCALDYNDIRFYVGARYANGKGE